MAALNRHSATLSLSNHRGLPLRFVEQSAVPKGMAYEAFISTSGQVPTRHNLHDLFNALVWLSFPHIKRQLNALQAAQIERAGIGTVRGPARDAATIFDENCALLVIGDTDPGRAWADAIRNHHWHRAFIEQRDTFNQHAQVWLFGHALLEKLVTPYKSITAHAWPVTVPETFFMLPHGHQRVWLDANVAAELTAKGVEGINTACFTPLPVLGLPGWSTQQDQAFYDDVAVFRAKRLATDG